MADTNTRFLLHLGEWRRMANTYTAASVRRYVLARLVELDALDLYTEAQDAYCDAFGVDDPAALAEKRTTFYACQEALRLAADAVDAAQRELRLLDVPTLAEVMSHE